MIEILCNDCLDTGWVEDREGRSVCSCISETDPYQQLQAECERLRELLHRAMPFIRLVLHSTEARYDDPQSEYYDDGAQYDVIRECREILAAIGAAMEGE